MTDHSTRPSPRNLPIQALILTIALISAPALADTHERPAAPRDGQIHDSPAGPEVWDARAQSWVDPESFWLTYAEQNAAENRGRFWGRTDTYPRYADVGEHDTILIEVDAGACLMYFFHRRWRRAEDVRRWDPGFNELGGCPHVFD